MKTSNIQHPTFREALSSRIQTAVGPSAIWGSKGWLGALLVFGIWSLELGVSAAPAAQTTNALSAVSRSDFSSFSVINERNIFNTRRRAGRSASTYVRTTSRARPDSFALVGTMSYAKGPLAFFDGNRSEFKKVLKPEETIAGFKVTDIKSSSVKLASPTNEIELRLGMQLHHDEQGWVSSERPETAEPSGGAIAPTHISFSNTSTNTSAEPLDGSEEVPAFGPDVFGAAEPGVGPGTNAPPSLPPGPDSDVLLRLMQRAAQERGE